MSRILLLMNRCNNNNAAGLHIQYLSSMLGKTVCMYPVLSSSDGNEVIVQKLIDYLV